MKGYKSPVRRWFRNVKYDLRRARVANDIADMYKERVVKEHHLPGYFKTWYTKSLNLEDPAVQKGYAVKATRELRTKQQIWDAAAKAVAKSKHTKDTMDKRMIRIARKVYSAERRQQAMAERQLADEATEGGFMSQVGTNLVSRAQSATKAVRELIIPSEISP